MTSALSVRSVLVTVAVAVVVGCSGCGVDGAPTPAPPGVFTCGVAPPLFDARGDVVQAESDAGCVRIERVTIDLGDDVICKACPYEAKRLIVHASGIDVDISDDAAGGERDDVGALVYEPSHHNWADVVTATAARESDALSVRILYDVDDGGWDVELPSADSAGSGDGVLLPVIGSR